MGFRFYSYFHCTTGPRVLRLRDAHLCFPWGWDAGGFLSQGFRPTLSAEQALSACARSGLLPTLTPSLVVLCCCALLGAGSPCACGGRGQVLALLAQLGRSVHQNLRNGALRKGPFLASLLAPRMPSWERSHITSTTRHRLSVITFLEPRFSTH